MGWVVRQFINGPQKGHFTIEVLHSDLNYATHQVITTEDWSETTIVRAGGFNERAFSEGNKNTTAKCWASNHNSEEYDKAVAWTLWRI